MWLVVTALLAAGGVGAALGQDSAEVARAVAGTVVQALKPSGIRIAVPDSPGISVVAVNANINFPIDIKDRGQLSQSIVESRNGYWTLEDASTTLKPGDVVFFWIYISKNEKQGRKEGRRIIKELVDPSCEPSPTTFNGRQACRGQVIFEDNFDTLNTDVWKHTIQFSGDPDQEFNIYDSKERNAFVEDGKLHISPTMLPEEEITQPLKLEGCTWKRTWKRNEFCERKPFSYNILPPVRSAWLTTGDNFAFRYGRLELHARAAKGYWMMSRAFLEPRDYVYGESPFDSGRTSFLRVIGNEDLREPRHREYQMGAGRSRVQCSIGTCYRVFHMYKDVRLPPGQTYSDETHVHSIVWTPESITFSVDGKDEHTVKPPTGGFLNLDFYKDQCDSVWKKGDFIVPFDKEFNINLAVQVGGIHNFADNSSSGEYIKPWKDKGVKMVLDFWLSREKWLQTWENDFEIDSIKVWAL